jgi:hypothetical protein
MTEQPTVKEPITEEPTQTPENAASDILSKLKDLQIDDPKKLENMAIASSQAGKLANDLGETRRALASVQEELNRIKGQSDTSYGGEIDLATLIDNRLETFVTKQQEKQRQAQEAYYRDMGKVQNDKRYPALKDTFEKHMQSYNVQQRINSGQTTASEEYGKIKDAYLDLLEENLTSVSKTTKPKPPHMETGTVTVPMPTIDEELKEDLKNKTDPTKGFSGTDQDIEALVRARMKSEGIF